ncbi:hypothetical protein BDV59DRAFT_206248 [Aspergillus ambiguus]|uniref:uncharacterized protein n=1 Tax=Aspergillus ambiguus TaxID=176160 RepID=UPI003CCDF7A4
MRYTLAIITTLAVAALAMPHEEEEHKPTVDEAKGQCGNAEVACCFNKHTNEGKGILGNVLGEGLVHNLLGNPDSACAPFNVLADLDILAITKKNTRGTTCKNTIACCPTGGNCTAISYNGDEGEE